jgi:hypothetical protein
MTYLAEANIPCGVRAFGHLSAFCLFGVVRRLPRISHHARLLPDHYLTTLIDYLTTRRYMPMLRHELTCQRPGCGRTFTARRVDARFCTRSCRRAKRPPAPPVEVASTAVDTGEASEVVEEEDGLQGWRRVGSYLIPPPDPSNTFTIW